MTTFLVGAFSGIAPRVAPNLLGDTDLQIANNVRLTSGAAEPLNDKQLLVPSVALKNGVVLSIYRFGQGEPTDAQHWFNETVDVDYVRTPVAKDSQERTYYTGVGIPKWTDATLATSGGARPAASYDTGIPKPATAPVLTPGSGGSGTNETRSYVYTYVGVYNGIQEEGPPSDPTQIVVLPGQAVSVAMATGPLSGNYPITKKRIYRTVVGSTAAAFEFVAEITLATTPFNDTVLYPSTVLASTNYFAPPTDMFGLTALSNGMMAGISGNQVCISEPWAPHAWPEGYRQTLDFKPIGLGAFGQSLVALTNGDPFIGYGTTPESLKLTRIKGGPATLSKRSICVIENEVIYASTDGFAVANVNGAEVVTRKLLTPKQWAAYNPASIIGGNWGGRYVGFYDTGTVKQALILDTTGSGALLSTTDIWANAVYKDPLRNTLYFTQGNQLYKFDAADALMTATVRSKLFKAPRPISPTWGQLIADAYPQTFRLYADGVLKMVKTVRNDRPFRLPGQFKGRMWELEAQITSTLRSMAITDALAELAQNG